MSDTENDGTEEAQEEEIILADLSDDDLVKQMHEDIYDGLAEEVDEGTRILLDRGWSASRVLDEALVAGMTIVGIDFRDGILFVPEVLLAANAMKAGMTILRPILIETGAKPVGKMVIGTVKGDIHDIGKNLVSMMMEGAGFEVENLGINTSFEEFMKAIEEHQPDILGMSALLTTTMPYMKVVVDGLVKEGVREKLIVLVGGAPLNEEFAESIGADAYCRDAATAVETATTLVAERRAQA
jgi:methylmalonyl-CoA mutase cobalamin-binding domain/chain